MSNLQTLTIAPQSISPYSLGIHAAYRIESYEGVTTMPVNPYSEPSQVIAWEEGFSNGTDDLLFGEIDSEIP